ncbi:MULTISPECIES: hypothetical protein [unclassified Streptococcus]|uniref:hypothetical protein n=1 Tax=unclassified Streptococcus TaxID=2608887 RepID=UPI001072177C|nr:MULTISPECIES: hypothetical protein [unclassified Streptococcus]MBF0786356.1 hypothetical protein [Streptococcus sp. 19428wC2_LYSM12]MCQ9212464.1 hypothetical protein [Streptococcus sp. B01]MCQ9213803.1 hypothetical protein [Streptococcus sp. O1]TFV06766.1 hypothetical protein E4T79_00200 [Streptococcus sp. LYSM12]
MQTPSKKKRKIVRKLFLLLLGISFIFIIVTGDLEIYSIYYEEQLATSEKERRDNVIKATITNLRSLNYEDIPNMRYDFDGTNFVENQNDSSGSYFPSVSNNASGYSYQDKEGNRYHLDENLHLTYAVRWSNTERKRLDLTQLNEEQLKDEMYDTLKPVIDAQKKPVIYNLQWLYKLLRK